MAKTPTSRCDRAHYTLGDLLAQCDLPHELPQEDREWLDAKPVGNEML
jgi:antitoxin ChpS